MDELKNLSRDTVTNLPSQSQALKCFNQCINNQANYQFGVVVFKPINFVQVNQVLGHHNSDLLLLQLAYAIQQKVEKNLNLVNFNTDEYPVRIARLPSLQFMVMLDLSHNEHAPKDYIDELCRSLSASIPDAISFKSFSLNFELAFGVDYFNEKSANITQTIAWACDALMDAEKNHQQLSFYNIESDQFTKDKLIKMELLKQDINAAKLIWHCQPQINVHTRQIIGFELSVFWQQSDNKLLKFDDFVELANNSGEIFQLANQMIDKALDVIQQNKMLNVVKPITINLLSTKLFEDSIVEYIVSQAKKLNIPTNLIVIEIPESCILLANDKAQVFMDLLKSIGIGIAIDHFSGSYNSLRYLRKFAITQVKIDCALLIINDDRQAEKAIVNALANLAKIMQLPVVGININNVSTLQLFKEVGGIYAQGNIISPSIEIKQLLNWTDNWIKLNPPNKEK